MRPKSDINKLNLQRELNRRLRFVQRRCRELPIEHRFATATISRLPKNMDAPPDWALAASVRAWETGFQNIERLKPVEGKMTGGDLVELMSLAGSLICYVTTPTPEIEKLERELPQLRSLRESVQRRVAPKLTRSMDRLSKALSKPTKTPSYVQYAEGTKRLMRGATGFIRSDGGLVGQKTISSRVYFLIWFAWPMIRKFQFPDVHALLTEFDERPSQSTTEAVITDLRKLAGNIRVGAGDPKTEM